MNYTSGKESYEPSGEKESKAAIIDLEDMEGLNDSYDALDRYLAQNNNDPNKTSDTLGNDLVEALRYHAPEIVAALAAARQELDSGLGFVDLGINFLRLNEL